MNIRVEPMASGTEPTLRDVVRVVWRARRGTLAGIVVGGALAAAYLNLTPKVYEAEIVVAPANQSDTGQLGGILGQLGGVGALMGVNIPMQGDGQDALATMRSRALAQAFVESEQLAPIMFPERWDARRNDWKSGRREPSMAEIVRHFDEKVRFVEEDRRTGMVSLRIRLASRAKVAPLANQYVALVNERLRDRAIRDAESALEYLRVQLAATGEVEIRQSIYRVMESQLTVAALARTRPEFAFRVLDPAAEPDERDHVAPRAAKVLAVGVFGGGALGIFAGLLWPVVVRGRRTAPN